MEVTDQLHAPAALPPVKALPHTHWIGGSVNPRAGLDDVEKRKFLTLSGLEIWPLIRPVHSQSLYRLCYPGSCTKIGESKEERRGDNNHGEKVNVITVKMGNKKRKGKILEWITEIVMTMKVMRTATHTHCVRYQLIYGGLFTHVIWHHILHLQMLRAESNLQAIHDDVITSGALGHSKSKCHINTSNSQRLWICHYLNI
jgi:hypothetical protein